jgi:thiamine monophosphate kinase
VNAAVEEQRAEAARAALQATRTSGDDPVEHEIFAAEPTRAASLPPGALAAALEPGDPRAAARLAWLGGEDYELLVCVAPERRTAAEGAAAGAGLTWIGRVQEGAPGVRWKGAPPASAGWRGFEH